MIFLILAILSSSLVSVMMRIGSAKAKNNIGMLAANYLTCSVLAFFYTLGQPLFSVSAEFSSALYLGLVNGLLFLSSFVIFQYNVQKNGVVLSSVFMKLGLIVPLVVSLVFFNEALGAVQIIGLVLAFAAIVMINISPEKSNGKIGLNLMLLLLIAGMAEMMIKIFEEVGREYPEVKTYSCFILLSFLARY